jgi:hypothetical protein
MHNLLIAAYHHALLGWRILMGLLSTDCGWLALNVDTDYKT